MANENKTPPWTNDDVRCATTSLISEISKYPIGHHHEVYKPGVAGEDLLKALTKLMNKIKINPKEYPQSMDLCTQLASIKNKGDKSDFNSHI